MDRPRRNKDVNPRGLVGAIQPKNLYTLVPPLMSQASRTLKTGGAEVSVHSIVPGTSSASAIASIIAALPQVEAVEVLDIPARSNPKPRWEITEEERDAIAEAKQLRATSGVPYWEAVILRFQMRGLVVPLPVIEATGRHHGDHDELIETVSVDQIGRLVAMAGPRPGGGFWALRSRLALRGGGVASLPMLDFRIPCSTTAMKTVERVLQHLGLRGIVVQTDHSYHFIGNEPLSEEAARVMLSRASLFGPIVDQRWAAHQLIDGVSALRLSQRLQGRTLQVVRTV